MDGGAPSSVTLPPLFSSLSSAVQAREEEEGEDDGARASLMSATAIRPQDQEDEDETECIVYAQKVNMITIIQTSVYINNI